jgi:receptor protein-tyrosine kinase
VSRNLAIGFVLGLLFGFGLAVVREILDTTVKQVEEVPALRDTPLLSALAFDGGVRSSPLISSLPTHAPRAEAFRVLRTNLSFVDVDSFSKAFVVTSSVPGEGKSTTAVNMAIAMASAEQRVLLIDGDLRRPQAANMLKLEGTVGLTTVLVGQVALNDAIQTHPESGLHVLTAGRIPPNPAELLQSRAMSDLLAHARAMFDVVVLDSPPLLPVTDAAVLAAQTDGAVIVVRYGKTTKEQVTGAVQRLQSVESEPLGVILNMIPAGGHGHYGYGYGYAPMAEKAKPNRKEHKERREPKPGKPGKARKHDHTGAPSSETLRIGRS